MKPGWAGSIGAGSIACACWHAWGMCSSCRHVEGRSTACKAEGAPQPTTRRMQAPLRIPRAPDACLHSVEPDSMKSQQCQGTSLSRPGCAQAVQSWPVARWCHICCYCRHEYGQHSLLLLGLSVSLCVLLSDMCVTVGGRSRHGADPSAASMRLSLACGAAALVLSLGGPQPCRGCHPCGAGSSAGWAAPLCRGQGVCSAVCSVAGCCVASDACAPRHVMMSWEAALLSSNNGTMRCYVMDSS
ncbi:hypothetical protein COO60DRAFT_94129 [Scenedesmus sp. NREL 46B-D3]|nr:hypothetical protein COO60DRAFT_94129 [Scenedesmus sp. NREL 46B-D3]